MYTSSADRAYKECSVASQGLGHSTFPHLTHQAGRAQQTRQAGRTAALCCSTGTCHTLPPGVPQVLQGSWVYKPLKKRVEAALHTPGPHPSLGSQRVCGSPGSSLQRGSQAHGTASEATERTADEGSPHTGTCAAGPAGAGTKASGQTWSSL